MKVFRGLGALARGFERAAIIHREALVMATGAASIVLERNTKATFGDNTKLESLADATQAERERLGYEADAPLLRTGESRDSVNRFHDGLTAGVGSDNPVLYLQTTGFVNTRTGTSVPPRDVFSPGIKDSEVEIDALVSTAIAITFNG